jgi:hypothetical protein
MAIQFPNSPSNGDQHTAAGLTYTFDGDKWVAYGYSSKYVQKSGDTMTGALNVPAGASLTQVPQIQEVVQKTGDKMTGALDVPQIISPFIPVGMAVCNQNGITEQVLRRETPSYNIIKYVQAGTIDGNFHVYFKPGEFLAWEKMLVIATVFSTNPKQANASVHMSPKAPNATTPHESFMIKTVQLHDSTTKKSNNADDPQPNKIERKHMGFSLLVYKVK